MAKDKTKGPKGKAKGKGKSAKNKQKIKDGIDNLSKLADHPLIGDLLAVGAMAAVAAIADKGFSGKGTADGTRSGGSAAVKAAGKAAAAAIGKRLISEFEGIKAASKTTITVKANPPAKAKPKAAAKPKATAKA